MGEEARAAWTMEMNETRAAKEASEVRCLRLQGEINLLLEQCSKDKLQITEMTNVMSSGSVDLKAEVRRLQAEIEECRVLKTAAESQVESLRLDLETKERE